MVLPPQNYTQLRPAGPNLWGYFWSYKNNGFLTTFSKVSIKVMVLPPKNYTQFCVFATLRPPAGPKPQNSWHQILALKQQIWPHETTSWQAKSHSQAIARPWLSQKSLKAIKSPKDPLALAQGGQPDLPFGFTTKAAQPAQPARNQSQSQNQELSWASLALYLT